MAPIFSSHESIITVDIINFACVQTLLWPTVSVYRHYKRSSRSILSCYTSSSRSTDLQSHLGWSIGSLVACTAGSILRCVNVLSFLSMILFSSTCFAGLEHLKLWRNARVDRHRGVVFFFFRKFNPLQSIKWNEVKIIRILNRIWL